LAGFNAFFFDNMVVEYSFLGHSVYAIYAYRSIHIAYLSSSKIDELFRFETSHATMFRARVSTQESKGISPLNRH